MALIHCPQCGKTISDRAVQCPHCGAKFVQTAPAPSKRKAFPMRVVIISLLSVVCLLAGIGLFMRYGFHRNQYVAECMEDTSVVDSVVDAEAYMHDSEAQLRKEEFRKFRSADLDALLLHGKVKEMTESCGIDYITYRFNQDGVLTEALPQAFYIYHQDNKLGLKLDEKDCIGGYPKEYIYEIDESGRLIECVTKDVENYTAETKYSGFDSNGWPTHAALSDYYGDTSEMTITYSGIDEYGNWTKKTTSERDEILREITYYPVEE